MKKRVRRDSKTKTYHIEANLAIECPKNKVSDLEEKIMEAIVNIIESEYCYLAGGIQFKELK